jgi:hypothetical protein
VGELRTIQILKDGTWHDAEFEQLEVGDVFRIFDDGVQVIDSYGNIQWTVREVPELVDGQILFVNVKEGFYGKN